MVCQIDSKAFASNAIARHEHRRRQGNRAGANRGSRAEKPAERLSARRYHGDHRHAGFLAVFPALLEFRGAGGLDGIVRHGGVAAAVSIVLQLMALWRSLQVADDSEPVYRRTLQWFLAGIVSALLGVAIASFAFTGP
jgi:hypothetical protein